MQTKDLIENYYHSFNERNWDKLINCLSEDIIHDINQGSREIGKEAFRKFILQMDENYSEKLNDLHVMVSTDGKRAAAEFLIEGVYKKGSTGLPKATGQKYRLPVGAFFEISNNKITRVTNYYNVQNWLHQVGQ